MNIATILAGNHNIDCTIEDLPVNTPTNEEIKGYIDRLAKRQPCFVGMSTMCNTFPRTLNVARFFKEQLPNVPIILGGPQASSCASKLLSKFSFIDCVVAGEAESVVDHLATDIIEGGRRSRPGILWRDDSCFAGPLFAPLIDIEDIEFPDYSTYPQALGNKMMSFEVGRGCPYACTFCSTNNFFSRRFRMKSARAIVSNIKRLKHEYGRLYFDFNHDMFTTNEKLVREICEALIAERLEIRWGCSARTDRVHFELLELMRNAGMAAVFYGIESASSGVQKKIRKNLDIKNAEKIIDVTYDMGIEVTASFVIGFPEETRLDLLETVKMFLRVRFGDKQIRSAQVHLLSPLSETEMTRSHFDNLKLDFFIADITSVSNLTDWELEQIEQDSEIFASFYYIHSRHIERETYIRLYSVMAISSKFQEFFTVAADCLGDSLSEHLLSHIEAQGHDRFANVSGVRDVRILDAVAWTLLSFVRQLNVNNVERELMLDCVNYGHWQYSDAEKGWSTFSTKFNMFGGDAQQIRRNHDQIEFVYAKSVESSAIRRVPIDAIALTTH